MNRFYRNYQSYTNQNYIEPQKIENVITDTGPLPQVFNLDEMALKNKAFRVAVWTGNHMQITVMAIPPKESIGLEIHPNVDQFIKIVQGTAI